jgi:lysophospholipase L1-like esterase
MTTTKRLLFASTAVVLSFALTVATLFVVDVYEHHKMASSAGLNLWGYRGPIVGRKKPGERRVVVVGESTAFGYGVRWQQSFPAYLQELLNQNGSRARPVTVVNLAYNNEGAHSYRFTLQDYLYLDYDGVIFYSGYNDIGLNLNVFRHGSPIFRLTGYMPILPLVLRDKAMAIRSGGRLEDAYGDGAIVFRPSLMQRTTASVLAGMATAMYAMDRPVKSEGASPDPAAIHEGAGCGSQWAFYCGEMYAAVKLALDRQKSVLIVTQPRLTDFHMAQQQRLVAFLTDRFGSANPLVRFADLSDAVDLTNKALSYDEMHLTAAGNRLIAEKLAGPISRMLQ